MIGDGRQQFYAFSHPQLGIYFYDQLTEMERFAVESRILAYAQEILVALNEGKLPPNNASSYIVRHYSTHLERTILNANVFLPLVSNGWRLAWETLEGTDNGFLNDVKKVWRAVERDDELMIEERHVASFISHEVYCALCQVSINTLIKNIPCHLLLLSVEAGIWTSVQGLAYAQQLPDREQQVKALAGLLPHLPDPLQIQICRESLEITHEIEHEETRAEALRELAPLLSDVLLPQILELTRQMKYEGNQLIVLTGLGRASQLSSELTVNALKMARGMEDEKYRVIALAALSRNQTDELKERYYRRH